MVPGIACQCIEAEWTSELPPLIFPTLNLSKVFLSSLVSGCPGPRHAGAMMILSLLAWFRRLYSLDTLDTRFTVPANTPIKLAAEDTRSGPAKDARSNAVASGASPSKWGTLEFYVYYVVFLIAIPLMFKTVVDVSQGWSSWP